MALTSSKEYRFNALSLENSLEKLKEKGITEVAVDDEAITQKREVFLRFLGKIRKFCPDIHFNFRIKIDCIDSALVKALSQTFCSLTIDALPHTVQDNSIRRNFTKKVSLLNSAGIVFGFILSGQNSSFKEFRNLIDFLFTLYPNHMEFAFDKLIPNATLSSVDIKNIYRLAFSIDVFYTKGRAVPWFLTCLEPLRIKPSSFFMDFSEWLECNNCTKNSGFELEKTTHEQIEKMQLVFLKIKFEEKNLQHLITALQNIVQLQGAFSRATCENTETVLELSYSPDDLISGESQNLQYFTDNVCMQNTKIRVYPGTDELEIEVL
jgi:hypothetical protein